jgi:hypothetical protein
MRVIKQIIDAGIDDHVFIMITRPDRPTVSLDLTNLHGRASLSVRASGMTIAGVMVDVKELGPAGDNQLIHRYCPICGKGLNLSLSGVHECDQDG